MANNVQNILVNPLLLFSALTLTGCSQVANQHAFLAQDYSRSSLTKLLDDCPTPILTQQVKEGSKPKNQVQTPLLARWAYFENLANKAANQMKPANPAYHTGYVKKICSQFENLLNQEANATPVYATINKETRNHIAKTRLQTRGHASKKSQGTIFVKCRILFQLENAGTQNKLQTKFSKKLNNIIY